LKANKEGKVLLNNDDGNVNSTLLLNLAHEIKRKATFEFLN
jgi:hypothetical protein